MAVEDNFKTKQDLPATPTQTNVLYGLTKVDYRDSGITRGEAGRKIRALTRRK